MSLYSSESSGFRRAGCGTEAMQVIRYSPQGWDRSVRLLTGGTVSDDGKNIHVLVVSIFHYENALIAKANSFVRGVQNGIWCSVYSRLVNTLSGCLGALYHHCPDLASILQDTTVRGGGVWCHHLSSTTAVWPGWLSPTGCPRLQPAITTSCWPADWSRHFDSFTVSPCQIAWQGVVNTN